MRPKKSFLEVCVFLGRPVKAPQVKRVDRILRGRRSRNIVHVRHRDEVEAPLTDWLREAYELPDRLAAAGAARKAPRKKPGAPAKKAATAKKARARTAGRKKAGSRKTTRSAVARKKGARGPRR